MTEPPSILPGERPERIPAERVFVEAELALAARGRAAASLSSSAGIGRAREDAFLEALAEHLPRRIAVVRGEIVDKSGARSGEVDAILADTDRPMTQIGSELLVPVETAIAGVEVKSTLVGGELEKAVRKVARIRKLTRVGSAGMFIRKRTPRFPLPPNRPMGIIYAYDGPALQTLVRKLRQNPDWYDDDLMAYGPDLVAILGKGSVTKNDHHILLPPPGAADAEVDIRSDPNIPGLQLIALSAGELLSRYGALSYSTYPISPSE